MTPLGWLLVLVSWVLFFALGWFARDLHLKGHLMPPIKRVVRWVKGSDPVVRLLSFVVVVLLLVSVMASIAYFRATDASKQSDQTAVCSERATADALVLWQSVKDQFSKPDPDESQAQRTQKFFDTIDTYISSLKVLQKARNSHDPAGVCERHDQ